MPTVSLSKGAKKEELIKAWRENVQSSGVGLM